MTSANVIQYTITKNGNRVGAFRKNVLCRLPEYSDLLTYEPLSEHDIIAWGYDEENLKVVLMAAIRDGMWVALNELKNSR